MTTSRRIAPLFAPLVAGVLLLGACSSESDTDTSGPTDVDEVDGAGGFGRSVRLFDAFAGCDDLADWTKERMLERVTAYGLEGGGWYGPWMEGVDDMTASTDAAAPTADAAGEGADGGGTSGTNTQEAGVDEGDVSETDGRFVYSVVDGVLRSVDLRTEKVVYERAVPIADQQMILSGDRLLLVAQDWSSGAADTVASVYDVSTGVPKLRERKHLEGTLVSVRAVDGVARIVLTSRYLDRIPFVQPNTSSAEDDALERNKEAIAALTVDDILPRSFTVGAKGQRGPLRQALDCDAVGHPGEFSGFNLSWVAAVDLGADDPAVTGSAGIVADASTVYASADHLYVGTVRWNDVMGDLQPVNPEPPHTDVHMFDLTAGGSAYLASGRIDGTVLNSYSLSEYDGSLRIATTSQASGFGADVGSGVHVLQRNGDTLDEVGAVTGLGIGEDIQAVRFVEDRGYVVTFRQVDPLYVLDLSDPTEPTLEGELKIPGYSTYLHPVGDGLVIGVGYAGTDSGQITGTQLSLFDVSDPATPTLLDTLDIGQSSEATFDPHAFLYWPETRQLVVPRELQCAGPITDGASPDTSGCESAIVVKVGDDSLTEQGRLFQWFPIRRSMIANGDLVTLSAGGVLVNDLASLEELADIRFDIPNTTAEDDLP